MKKRYIELERELVVFRPKPGNWKKLANNRTL